ncbi:MAG: ABC transporter substrate-binding protein [Rhodobacteraceae bacterium]|nr:ABC transporter substrate-binding protein [Paracoccaceae bacterium]
MKRRTLVALAAVAASLTMSVSTAFAGTVIDTMNRTVEVPDNVNRVLLGFYFEDFYAIGGPDAYDKVVAISRPAWEGWRNSQWKSYNAVNPALDALVDVGEVDAGTFAIEKAVVAKPDVAIIAAWQYRAMGEIVGKLEAAGIPVVVVDFNAQTVEKHVASTLLIGKVIGAEERAQELVDNYVAAVADVEARVAKALEARGGKKPKVYVELGSKGAGEYGNSYGSGMWGGVVELAGGKNIAAGKVESWGPLNPEYVIALNPDVVFIAGSYWMKRDNAVLMGFGVDPAQTRERLMPFTQRAGWPGLMAVKKDQIYAVYHGGARTLYDYTFLQYMAKAMYPEAFADVDPVANHKAYYTKYLPITAEGTFMLKLAD